VGDRKGAPGTQGGEKGEPGNKGKLSLFGPNFWRREGGGAAALGKGGGRKKRDLPWESKKVAAKGVVHRRPAGPVTKGGRKTTRRELHRDQKKNKYQKRGGEQGQIRPANLIGKGKNGKRAVPLTGRL